MSEKKQLSLDFEPGLTARFPNFMDCVRASIYGCEHPFGNIARDLDMSVSWLSQCLAPKRDGRTANFPLEKLPDLLRITGDLRPLHWLIEQFLEKPEARQARVLSEAEKILKDLPRLLEALKK